MQSQLVALVILTSLFQVRREWKPIPEPPRRADVVHVGVRVAGIGEVRRISIVMPAPPAPADEGDEQPPAPPIMRFNIHMAVVERENFDRWLFADEQSESEHRRHLREILQTKVETAARERELTDLQRAKLHVAGMGDIKRFFDRVAESRSEFEVARQSFLTGRAALLRLEPLAQIYQEGAFGDGSLFSKALRKIARDQTKADR